MIKEEALTSFTLYDAHSTLVPNAQ